MRSPRGLSKRLIYLDVPKFLTFIILLNLSQVYVFGETNNLPCYTAYMRDLYVNLKVTAMSSILGFTRCYQDSLIYVRMISATSYS